MKTIRSLLAACGTLLLLAQCTTPLYEEPTEEDTEGGMTAVIDDGHVYDQLSWEGETDKFRFEDDGTIRLYDESRQTGTAFVCAPLSTPDRTCWKIHVRLSFNPSANNHVRIYLMASEADLGGPLDGYFLQVGGEEDRLYFYRQEGDTFTLLGQSEEFMQGDNSPEVHIRAERDSQGYFLIYASELDVSPFPFFFDKDNVIRDGAYCGILCTYTGSRSREMRFPEFRIHHDIRDVTELYPVASRPRP